MDVVIYHLKTIENLIFKAKQKLKINYLHYLSLIIILYNLLNQFDSIFFIFQKIQSKFYLLFYIFFNKFPKKN